MTDRKIIIRESTLNEHNRVGLKIVDNNYEFTFPYGYRERSFYDEKISDKERLEEINREVYKFIELITTYGENVIFDTFEGEENNIIPLYAMTYIIVDYINNGIYRERKLKASIDVKGKIIWKDTIKSNNAVINDNNEVFYKNYNVNKNEFLPDEKFDEIERYCLNCSIKLLGWYYGFVNVDKIKEYTYQEKIMFLNYLNLMFENTFIDRKRELIKSMIKVLTYSSKDDNCILRKEIFTENFNIVFENLVVKKLSNIDKNDLKNFYPTSYYVLDNIYKSSNLRPDAILIIDKKIYIIDAKYYGYGFSDIEFNKDFKYNINYDRTERKNFGSLPSTSDSIKQISYADYLKYKLENDEDFATKYNLKEFEIYNVFVLPTDKKGNFKYLGFNVVEWYQKDITYHKIHLVGVNLNYIINSKNILDEFKNFCKREIN